MKSVNTTSLIKGYYTSCLSLKDPGVDYLLAIFVTNVCLFLMNVFDTLCLIFKPVYIFPFYKKRILMHFYLIARIYFLFVLFYVFYDGIEFYGMLRLRAELASVVKM